LALARPLHLREVTGIPSVQPRKVEAAMQSQEISSGPPQNPASAVQTSEAERNQIAVPSVHSFRRAYRAVKLRSASVCAALIHENATELALRMYELQKNLNKSWAKLQRATDEAEASELAMNEANRRLAFLNRVTMKHVIRLERQAGRRCQLSFFERSREAGSRRRDEVALSQQLEGLLTRAREFDLALLLCSTRVEYLREFESDSAKQRHLSEVRSRYEIDLANLEAALEEAEALVHATRGQLPLACLEDSTFLNPESPSPMKESV
jgi:hypothetical protein